MTIRLFPLIFVILISAGGLCGQAIPFPTPPVSNNYESLIAKLKSGNTDLDFTALRLGYSSSTQASPYGADHDSRRRMNAAAIEKRCDDAQKMADDLLAVIYISPDAHVAKSNCYRASGDDKKAELHKAIYLGLINSILAKGNGNSPEAAYTVVTIEEEYSVMKALQYSVWGQSYQHVGEHTYEVLSATDSSGKQVKIYFSIDIPLALERRRKAAN